MQPVKKTIHTIIREKSSRNGNPIYTVVFDDSSHYKTKPDCACAYGITNYRKGEHVAVTLEEYRGNVVIADIEQA